MGRPSVAYLLSVVIAITCGCARPLPPADSRISAPPGFVHRFSSMPRIVVEEQPTAPFRLSPEERQAAEKAREEFNKAREERVSRLTDQGMSRRDSVEGMTVDCIVIWTFIILSPLCLLVVPVTYGTTTLIERRRASRSEPYMPALPSEQQLLAVHEKISSHVTANGIADRLRIPASDREGTSADPFPRLLITPSFVTFSAERSFMVKFLVQGQPSADVSWPQTEHIYHVGYHQNAQRLMTELTQGEARLAESISTTYGLWAYGGRERRTATNTAPNNAPRYSESYQPSKPQAAAGLPEVVEQEPRLRNQGCAPFDARVGNTYQRADGSRVAIVRIVGKSPACTRGARPIAVEIEPA